MIGVLFATTLEAAPFLRRFEPAIDPAASPSPGGYEWGDTVAAVCGMGRAAAAEGTRRLIDRYRPEGILNLGIAGALTSIPIGGVRRVAKVTGWPEAEGITLDHPLPGFDDIPVARLVTAPRPVFDDGLRRRLSALGDMVDMEGVEVARVCRAGAVPLAMIKCISDTAGDGERALLRENLEAMAEKLAGLAWERLAPRRG